MSVSSLKLQPPSWLYARALLVPVVFYSVFVSATYFFGFPSKPLAIGILLACISSGLFLLLSIPASSLWFRLIAVAVYLPSTQISIAMVSSLIACGFGQCSA